MTKQKIKRRRKGRAITAYVPKELANEFVKKVYEKDKTISSALLELIKEYVEKGKKEG